MRVLSQGFMYKTYQNLGTFVKTHPSFMERKTSAGNRNVHVTRGPLWPVIPAIPSIPLSP